MADRDPNSSNLNAAAFQNLELPVQVANEKVGFGLEPEEESDNSPVGLQFSLGFEISIKFNPG
jgi:hypothetical protein